MPGAVDHLVVLTSTLQKLATKRIIASRHGGPPVIENYPRGSTVFSITEIPVSCFDEMAAALAKLQAAPYSFVVRGRPVDGIDRRHALRRARARKDQPATLEAAARHWIPLDLDSILCPAGIDPLFEPDRVVEHVIELLPTEFHGASCFWSFTASHGLKPGIRLRLWFWADRPVEDWELKTWLRDGPVDLSLYSSAQPIYTAAPIFVDVRDPVPFRFGTWTGYSDAVTPPVIEKEQPRARQTESPSSADGGVGYDHHRERIGGEDGFNTPIKAAVGAYLLQHGAAVDSAWLRDDLEQVIRERATERGAAYVETRVRDLDTLIPWVREQQEAREAEDAEPVEPTYAPPPDGDTLAEARAKLVEEARRFTETSLAYIERTAALKAEAEARGEEETWRAPLPPVCPINAAIGLGKTRAWREEVAARFVERGRHPALSLPRHKLGTEIVRDFAEAGIVARDFRGREYPDPEQPGKTMCHDLERIKAIEEAGGDIHRQACRSKGSKCAFYDTCGYQAQRRERPDVWLMPHQMLTRPKPAFLKCDTLGIDESFWSVPLHGVEHRVTLELSALIIGDRSVPEGHKGGDGPTDAGDTFDLVEISQAVYDAVLAEPDGRLRRAELTKALNVPSASDRWTGRPPELRDRPRIDPSLRAAGVSLDDLRLAYRLEWRRKIKLDDVTPGMPPAAVKELCGRAAAHNRNVAKLARFWQLLADTIAGEAARSPWLDLKHETKTHKDTVEPAVRMAWCDEIHESWRGVPTMILDATMPTEIVRRFYPGMAEPVQITAPTPHVHVRQITDKPMSKNRLIPTGDRDTPQNRTRRANVERVRRFIEVRAFEAGAGKMAVICNKSLEDLLKEGAVPANVEIDHFNNVTGENRFSDVAVLILIGRPEAPPLVTELAARVLFAADIDEIAVGADGRVNYPLVTRGIRMRDGKGVPVKGPQHPDPRVEEVRWAICEAELIQAAGRGRGVNRTAANPLQLDILTNVALPIEVDEATTWEAIQPKLIEVMRARGAAPLGYADMAACYPDLFLVCQYRRRGSRGPPGRLLYDPARIDPAGWLTERLGEVTVQPGTEPPAARQDREAHAQASAEEAAAPLPAEPEQPAADDVPPEPAAQPATAAAPASAGRRCEWFVPQADNRSLRHCGREIELGLAWCPEHIGWSAQITNSPGPVLTATLVPPLGAVSNDAGGDDPPGRVRANAGDFRAVEAERARSEGQR